MPQEDRVSGQERARHQKGGGIRKSFKIMGKKVLKDFKLILYFGYFFKLFCVSL
jgi:hypothetical protein